MALKTAVLGALALAAAAPSAHAQGYYGAPQTRQGYYIPVQPRPQAGPPCGHAGTAPCPRPQSGTIDFSNSNASPDQLYQMSLEAQRRGDISAKMQYMQRAAELGQVNAMTGLGVDLITGKDIAKDPPRGIRLLEKAAATGHAAAEWQLGTVYDNGEVVPRNGALALKWISAAAAQHYADAEDWVGVNYELGANGVARDRPLAIQWLDRAASDGQNGIVQRMVEYLSRPSTPRFASYDQLKAGFQKAFNEDYAAFYGSRGGGKPGLNYGSCTGIYASSACAHSAFSDAYERSR